MKRFYAIIIAISLCYSTTAQQTNYHFSHTIVAHASREAIWHTWTYVPGWHTWDTELKSAVLFGSFTVGSKGKLVPKSGPKSTFVVSEVNEDTSYTFKTRIPFGWLVIRRSMAQSLQGLVFTHEVRFTGPFRKLIGRKIGCKFRTVLPQVMNAVDANALQHQVSKKENSK